MTCIYYYSIIHNSFIAPKSSVLHLFIPPSLLTTATIDIFTVSIVSLSPEFHMVGIIYYVAFSDWLVSLRDMHLSLFHVFSWLDSSFLFSAE